MGSTSSAAFLGKARGVERHREPQPQRPPPLLQDCCAHFLAVTAFCRFQSLSVPSSEAVSSADWLWWKARERMPS